MTVPALDDLLRRIRALEDRAEIEQLIAAYGPSVDSGAAAETAALWTEDGRYAFAAPRGADAADPAWAPLAGREAIDAMVRGPMHQRFIGAGSAHFLGPAHIEVDGDRAVAVTYSLLVLHADDRDGHVVARAGANRWDLVRTAAGWRVERRVQSLLDGRDEARELLRAAAGPGRAAD